ncbi:hypothetical protein LIER_17873 [Lithospermum erythrorhizon]|uniref:Uncharacterized protein n=1 Tax=Lithospermum erythrorhizon TaxID=34254 RepID=A0AAV3QC54_LITER
MWYSFPSAMGYSECKYQLGARLAVCLGASLISGMVVVVETMVALRDGGDYGRLGYGMGWGGAKMDNSQSASYNAGQAKGQAQEKGNQMMNKAGDMAQSAKESAQNAGQQVKAKAQGAADAVKNATK